MPYFLTSSSNSWCQCFSILQRRSNLCQRVGEPNAALKVLLMQVMRWQLDVSACYSKSVADGATRQIAAASLPLRLLAIL